MRIETKRVLRRSRRPSVSPIRLGPDKAVQRTFQPLPGILAPPGSEPPSPLTACQEVQRIGGPLASSCQQGLAALFHDQRPSPERRPAWPPAQHECQSRESAAGWRIAKLRTVRWKPASIRTAPSSPEWRRPDGLAATPPRRSHPWSGFPPRPPRPVRRASRPLCGLWFPASPGYARRSARTPNDLAGNRDRTAPWRSLLPG